MPTTAKSAAPGGVTRLCDVPLAGKGLAFFPTRPRRATAIFDHLSPRPSDVQ